MIVGRTITGVYWIPDSTERDHCSRYFITLDSGPVVEVRQNGIAVSELPRDAKGLDGFSAIIGKSTIRAVDRTPNGDELAIQLHSGHLLHVFGTFDGENVGNNFTVAAPPHEENWDQTMQAEWNRLFP